LSDDFSDQDIEFIMTPQNMMKIVGCMAEVGHISMTFN
jgi:hypothetical protein